MNYHNITCPDMNNGDGLRVVLWVSGCSHHCVGCQNPQTWDENSGIKFDDNAMNELLDCINKDYISGITLSGGDPLYKNNINTIASIIAHIKSRFPNKTVWIYTGYTFEELHELNNSNINTILRNTDVLIDGEYIKELRDITLKWVGSSNQRVINVKETLRQNKIILY